MSASQAQTRGYKATRQVEEADYSLVRWYTETCVLSDASTRAADGCRNFLLL